MTVTASILCAVDVYPPPLPPLEEGDAQGGEDGVRLLAKIKRKLVNLSEPFQ
jgi:hypothetical protein